MLLILCSATDHLVGMRSEEHTSELQSRFDLVCRLLLEKKNSQLTAQLLNRLLVLSEPYFVPFGSDVYSVFSIYLAEPGMFLCQFIDRLARPLSNLLPNV